MRLTHILLVITLLAPGVTYAQETHGDAVPLPPRTPSGEPEGQGSSRAETPTQEGPGSAPREALGAALRTAIEEFAGTEAHGRVALRYRARWNGDDTDQDLFNDIEVRLGDEAADRFSVNLVARTDWDLDAKRTRRRGDYEFIETSDKFGSAANTRLYAAYVNWRPGGGQIDWVRLGRQYVVATHTFHVDGVQVQTAELEPTHHLRATLYAGIPAHLYESSPSGDWLAGARLEGRPWEGADAALEYTHVKDDLTFLGAQRDDLAAAMLRQRFLGRYLVSGDVVYLDSLRDATVRAAADFSEQDLMVQAVYHRQFERRREASTEFDPYFAVLHTMERFQSGELRVTKGFGEELFVEFGAGFRDVRPAGREGAFNRDTTRLFLAPTFENVPWEDSALTLVAEQWTGDGVKSDTFGGEIEHRFSSRLRCAFGSDYYLYKEGPLSDGQRNDVRTVFAEVRYKLDDSLEAQIRHQWEEDDEESIHVFSLGLTLRF